MKFLIIFASLLTSFAQAETFRLPYARNHNKVLDQAASLGAPMEAVRTALHEAEDSEYRVQDVVTVFDLSQPSSQKRLYVLDLRAGTTTAYHSSHGKGNGSALNATSFRDFVREINNKTPLGALITDDVTYPDDQHTNITDPRSGKRYPNQNSLRVDGTKDYNREINNGAGYGIIVFHSSSYATAGFRRNNGGAMGRSLGCIVLDPEYNNQVLARIAGGSLVFVTVGNDPVEKYLR